MNVKQLGQIFTPSEIVRRMLTLRQNFGTVLEPAAGEGAFLGALEKTAVGVEIDSLHAKKCGALCLDFFDYSVDNKFDTIIGNPPFVRYRDAPSDIRKKLCHSLFDRRSNLYLFFVEKCLRHLNDGGELIFITPRDFLKATAAVKLNRLLYECGTITDYIELGDARVFVNATPNCAIWRFVKGDFSRRANVGKKGGKKFTFINGQLAFIGDDYETPFHSLFEVKVGAVSGMDSVFADSRYGNRDFVFSQTATSGKTRRMLYGVKHPALARHKKELLARKIRKFDESNWWQWGRAHYESARPRIYVNAKTRNRNPFFIHRARDYDGSVLAVFPRDAKADLQKMRVSLNKVNWEELGFVCGGRFIFGQRSLQNCVLPRAFSQFN